MDNHHTTDTARQRSGRLMFEETRQGRSTLKGAEDYSPPTVIRSNTSARQQPRKTLKAGAVIPWSSGSEHLNLEHNDE